MISSLGRLACGLGLAVSLSVTSAGAHAAGESRPIADAIALGPSRCLDARTLAEHIAMWLHKTEIDRRLELTVADAPDGVRFVVRRDGTVLGERTLDVEKVPCQDIHAAVGLGIASAIDATILGDLGVPRPAPAPPLPILTPTPPPVAAPVWIPALAVPPPIAPRNVPTEHVPGPVITMTLQGMILLGVLPRDTLAVAPAVEISFARGLDLRGSALATGKTTIDLGGGTADAGLVAGRLDGCVTRILFADVARVRGCVGILAGAVSSKGAGFNTPRSTSSPWVAPALRVDARWSFSRVFGVVLGVDGFFPGLKPELQVLDAGGTVVAAEAFPLAGVGVSVGPSLTF